MDGFLFLRVGKILDIVLRSNIRGGGFTNLKRMSREFLAERQFTEGNLSLDIPDPPGNSLSLPE